MSDAGGPLFQVARERIQDTVDLCRCIEYDNTWCGTGDNGRTLCYTMAKKRKEKKSLRREAFQPCQGMIE